MNKHGTPAVEGYYIDFLQTVIANLPRNISKKEAQYLANNGQLMGNFFAYILKKFRGDNVMNIIMREGIVVENPNILEDGRIFEEANENNQNYQINFDLAHNKTTGEGITNTLLDSKYCQPTNLYEFLSGFFSSILATNTSPGCYFVSTGIIEISGMRCLPILYQKQHDSWHLDIQNIRYEWPKNTYFIYLRS